MVEHFPAFHLIFFCFCFRLKMFSVNHFRECLEIQYYSMDRTVMSRST